MSERPTRPLTRSEDLDNIVEEELRSNIPGEFSKQELRDARKELSHVENINLLSDEQLLNYLDHYTAGETMSPIIAAGIETKEAKQVLNVEAPITTREGRLARLHSRMRDFPSWLAVKTRADKLITSMANSKENLHRKAELHKANGNMLRSRAAWLLGTVGVATGALLAVRASQTLGVEAAHAGVFDGITGHSSGNGSLLDHHMPSGLSEQVTQAKAGDHIYGSHGLDTSDPKKAAEQVKEMLSHRAKSTATFNEHVEFGDGGHTDATEKQITEEAKKSIIPDPDKPGRFILSEYGLKQNEAMKSEIDWAINNNKVVWKNDELHITLQNGNTIRFDAKSDTPLWAGEHAGDRFQESLDWHFFDKHKESPNAFGAPIETGKGPEASFQQALERAKHDPALLASMLAEFDPKMERSEINHLINQIQDDQSLMSKKFARLEELSKDYKWSTETIDGAYQTEYMQKGADGKINVYSDNYVNHGEPSQGVVGVDKDGHKVQFRPECGWQPYDEIIDIPPVATPTQPDTPYVPSSPSPSEPQPDTPGHRPPAEEEPQPEPETRPKSRPEPEPERSRPQPETELPPEEHPPVTPAPENPTPPTTVPKDVSESPTQQGNVPPQATGPNEDPSTPIRPPENPPEVYTSPPPPADTNPTAPPAETGTNGSTGTNNGTVTE